MLARPIFAAGPVASWLPQCLKRQAMASLTAFLVVLTLTGEPVVNALCDVWCDTSSETRNCGEAIAQTAVPELTTVAGTACAALLTTAPFLREEGPTASRMAVAVSLLAIATLQETRFPQGLSPQSTTGPAPPLVLRR